MGFLPAQQSQPLVLQTEIGRIEMSDPTEAEMADLLTVHHPPSNQMAIMNDINPF
jgi:hypothetical protein